MVAVGTGQFRKATGQDQFGFVEERAQKLALPAIPHAGTNRLDIADGQDQEELQPLHGLHGVGEVDDGLAIVEIT